MCFAAPASNCAMQASASMAIDFFGTMRSRRQASTAASNFARVPDW